MIARKNQEEIKMKETVLAVYRAWTWKEKITPNIRSGREGREKENQLELWCPWLFPFQLFLK